MELFKTQDACRIARIHRDRFNEAVAADFYPCAPVVARGATRLFSRLDLVGLYIYGRLLDNDFPPRLAGRFACKIQLKLQEEPEAKSITYLRDEGGLGLCIADIDSNDGRYVQSGLRRGIKVIEQFRFDVEHVLSIIDGEIADAAAKAAAFGDGE
jgi:hypothetical protein